MVGMSSRVLHGEARKVSQAETLPSLREPQTYPFVKVIPVGTKGMRPALASSWGNVLSDVTISHQSQLTDVHYCHTWGPDYTWSSREYAHHIQARAETNTTLPFFLLTAQRSTWRVTLSSKYMLGLRFIHPAWQNPSVSKPQPWSLRTSLSF